MKELKSFERLVDNFMRLPSVGRKSAERMAYAVLNMDDSKVAEFSDALLNIKKKVHQCPICGLFTEDEYCEICSDDEREKFTIIVLSRATDVINFEKIGSYKGSYHVLNGTISAIKGISIEDLNVASLLKRIDKGGVKEIILALDATIEGETTAIYLSKLLEDKKITITRLAYGIPMGGHLDYADSLTIEKALEGRKKI